MIPFTPTQLSLGAWCSAARPEDFEFQTGTTNRVDTIRDAVSGEMPLGSRGKYALIAPDNHAPTYGGTEFLNGRQVVEIEEGQWLAGQRKAWTFVPASAAIYPSSDVYGANGIWGDDPLWIPLPYGGSTSENRFEIYNNLKDGYTFGANTAPAHLGRDYHSFAVIKINPPAEPPTNRANQALGPLDISTGGYDYNAGIPIWTGQFSGEHYHWLGLTNWTPGDPTAPGTMRFCCAPSSSLYADGNESYVDFQFNEFGQWIIIDVRRVGYESVLRINGTIRATSTDLNEFYALDEIPDYGDNVCFFGTCDDSNDGILNSVEEPLWIGTDGNGDTVDFTDGIGSIGIGATNQPLNDRASEVRCLPWLSLASGAWAEWVHVKVATTQDDGDKVRAFLASKWELLHRLPPVHPYRAGVIPGIDYAFPDCFPPLTPSSRTFTPSSRSSTPYSSIGGRDRSLLHSNEVDFATLELSFLSLDQSDVELVRSHYQSRKGNFEHFALAPETTVKTTVFAEGIDRDRSLGEYAPTGRSWRYDGSPVAEQKESGFWDLKVKLRLTNVDFKLAWDFVTAAIEFSSTSSLGYSRIENLATGQVQTVSDVAGLTRNWFFNGNPVVEVGLSTATLSYP